MILKKQYTENTLKTASMELYSPCKIYFKYN